MLLLPTRRMPLLLPVATLTVFITLAWMPMTVEGAVNGRPSSGAEGDGDTCDLASATEDTVRNLRISAIFIVLVSSSLGIILPFLPQLASASSSSKTGTSPSSKARKIWDETFFILKYAGVGIILATAFVHLSYESYVQLASPCINLVYSPLAPVLSMASLLVIFLIDCYLTRYLHQLRKKHERNKRMLRESQQDNDINTTTTFPLGLVQVRKTVESLERDEEIDKLDEARLDEKSRMMEVMIIEGGIVFHSVMVGLGLGVSSAEGFVPYFVAITFHQFFDGCAIGTRMALLNFVGKRKKQFAMFAAYGLVTPFGIALGVGVRNTFQANDPSTILTIGVLDSLSAGILLYGALVNLIAKDFLTGEMLEVSNSRLGVALVSLFVGAALMSLLGQWA